MSNKRNRYDPAYKLEICKSVDSGTATVAELSRETPFVGSGHALPENKELVRLRRENRDMKEEIEILKLAATYFAKNQK